ncbi:MAG: hypothetical protein II401_00850 [Bacteroidales bacterium]|nr:hypothetical protein [Bacteroidales bacterium]
MKKILFAIALMLTTVLGTNAQNDRFFSNWDIYDNGVGRYDDGNGLVFNLPTGHGLDTNSDAPLGSGILILTALGAGYAVYRKRK